MKALTRAGGPIARACASSRGAYPDAVTETPPALARLLSLVQGFRSTQVTYVIAKLGLADQLAESPLTAKELAAKVKVDASSLGRVLRLAAFYGLVNELPGDRFELTPLAEPLRTGV